MTRGDKIRLTVDIPSHEPRRPFIKAGTEGEVLVTRFHQDDTEAMALVKFKGWGGPRSVEQSKLVVQ